MTIEDFLMYSSGKYYLFEHIDAQGRNILQKIKYHDKRSFMMGAGGFLDSSQEMRVCLGETVITNQPDGTKFSFKWVDL